MSATPSFQGNQGIEKMSRYHMQHIPSAKPRKARRLRNDLTMREGGLTLAGVARQVLLAELALRKAGIGTVEVDRVIVREGAVFFGIRYFTPLDGVAGAERVRDGWTRERARYADYVLTAAPDVFVHWRKYEKSTSGGCRV